MEPGDCEDVVGQAGEFHGFSRYAFHDIEPVNTMDAVVIIVTESPGISVSGDVQPQYLIKC